MPNHYKRDTQMATKKQKKELMEILKFTPINVKVMIHGYGGECYIGKVDREIYDFFKEKEVNIEQYANDWDNEYYQDIPAKYRFFEPGSPYEYDNLCHASGATMDSSSHITIDDENGNTLWESTLNLDSLENAGVSVNVGSDNFDAENLRDGEVVFWGGQGEKGCFFDGEITLRAPFDPKKLSITYSNADGWLLTSDVEYDGEEIDGSGGYSTTGKWGEHKFWIAGDEEVYDAEERDEGRYSEEEWDPAAELEKIEVPAVEFKEDQKSVWFANDVTPLRKGEYEIMEKNTEWPFPMRAEWTGRIWKQDGKKVNIKQWRGLNYDPTK